jgi:long-chain acyl-CoA synthetase
MPGTEHKVVDIETGLRELGPGEEGELCLRGPQVMLGYWNRPADTAQTLRDGWVYSGDLARLDEDGYCAIVGRKKDMIIVNGCNVYPDEVDGVLLSHPSVLEAATIGVPDPQRGEVVRSYVVVRPGMSVTADELRDHCRKLMSAYKVPRHFDIVTDLPKSSMMKVLRTELRSRAVNEKGS